MRNAFRINATKTGGFHHTESHKKAIINCGKMNRGKNGITMEYEIFTFSN
jgi:hypothetical protein